MAAMGWAFAIGIIVLYVGEQGLSMGANIWLRVWSDDNSSQNDTAQRDMYLGVYAAFGFGQGLYFFMFIPASLWATGTYIHVYTYNIIILDSYYAINFYRSCLSY